MKAKLFAITCAKMIAVAGASGANAGTIKPVSMEAYQAAAAAGKPVIFYVKADWCPVCAKETPIIQSLMQDPAFKDYEVLVVDFDKNKAALQMLHVDRQSTIIVNRGDKEIDRATGLTDSAAIRALIAKAG